MGWVELAGHPGLLAEAPFDFGWIDGIGEIRRQQWFEATAVGQGFADAAAIGLSGRSSSDRRAQIWHHDRPGELAGRSQGDGLEHGAIPQMHMPVIGLTQAQLLAWHGAGSVVVELVRIRVWTALLPRAHNRLFSVV
jgi:hypothetical protein